VLFHPDDAPLTVEEHIVRQKMNQRIINKASTRFGDNPFKDSIHPVRHFTYDIFLPSLVLQTSMARAQMNHAQNQQGKVDVLGHVGGLHASALGLLATPDPAPGMR
jgi:hypothetical protein